MKTDEEYYKAVDTYLAALPENPDDCDVAALFSFAQQMGVGGIGALGLFVHACDYDRDRMVEVCKSLDAKIEAYEELHKARAAGAIN